MKRHEAHLEQTLTQLKALLYSWLNNGVYGKHIRVHHVCFMYAFSCKRGKIHRLHNVLGAVQQGAAKE